MAERHLILPIDCFKLGRRALLVGTACLLAAADAPAPFRVLVIGDSQAQGLAGGLQWVFRHDRTVRVLDRSKISTGLLFTSSYNWPAQVRTLAPSEHADVAVVMFGANDRPGVRKGGHIDPTMAKNFQQSYGAKVRDVVKTLIAAHTPVIWVGHPIVRDPAYAEDMALLNGVYADASVSAGAQFVPLWDIFQGPDHAYTAYGPDTDGDTTRLRADDGVHLTRAGYQVAAKLLLPLIEAHRPAAPSPATAAKPPAGNG